MLFDKKKTRRRRKKREDGTGERIETSTTRWITDRFHGIARDVVPEAAGRRQKRDRTRLVYSRYDTSASDSRFRRHESSVFLDAR